MKKVLLITPPFKFGKPQSLCLGLASIAAYLKQKGENIDISVIDAWAEELEYKELEDRVAQTGADLIGVYMTGPRYEEAKSTIEACRTALPGSLIVAGGPHPTAMPIETLNEIPQLDICCIGEGEITMFELVKAIQNSSQLSGVNGLAYRENSNIKITKPREFIKNLDELPFLARELFPLDKYAVCPPFGRKTPWFFVSTSRGCPFQCVYCFKNIYQDTFRTRSPKNVVDEIEELINKYQAKEIQFSDDDFTLDMSRAEGICDEILKRGIKIRWGCLTRVDKINEALLRKMKEAGCWMISYGIESGNQMILDSMNKGIKIEQIISAFEIHRRVGISTICSFIVGLPGETKKTIQDTLNLIKKIKPTFITGGVLVVFPGSRLHQLIQTKKYPGRLRTLTAQEGLARIFVGKGNYITYEENLTYEESRDAIVKIERAFYLRPQYILQSLKSIRSFSDFNYYLNGSVGIIKSFIPK